MLYWRSGVGFVDPVLLNGREGPLLVGLIHALYTVHQQGALSRRQSLVLTEAKLNIGVILLFVE